MFLTEVQSGQLGPSTTGVVLLLWVGSHSKGTEQETRICSRAPGLVTIAGLSGFSLESSTGDGCNSGAKGSSIGVKMWW